MAYLREASERYFKITKGYALEWLINVFSNNQLLKYLRNIYYHKIPKEYGKRSFSALIIQLTNFDYNSFD